MLNGVTELMMMKSDVMNQFESIMVATKYNYKGIETTEIPFDALETDLQPIYTDLKGWKEDTTKARNFEELPVNFKEYVKFIEREVGVPIKLISLGPDREETIIR